MVGPELQLSHAQVSRVAAKLCEGLKAWRERPLGEGPYLFLNAIYMKVCLEGRIVDCAVLIAVGIESSGKLVCVVQGEVFHVAVDLRKSRQTVGQRVGEILSAESKRQIWMPEGFAHGFVVLSDAAEFLYKTTDYYAPVHECFILWDDATLAIQWPAGVQSILSAKDVQGKPFIEAEVFA